MEPERRIEKLLRAFAKKRREQAGDPLALHPVARQQLQKEIARRAAGTSRAGWFSSFFHGLRPRLAFALCFALVVTGLIFLPHLRERKISTLASANLSRQEMVPAKKMEPAVQPPPSVVPMAPATDERKRAAQDKRPDDSVNTAMKSMPPAVANNQSIVQPAEAPKQSADVQSRVAQTPVSTSVATASPVPSTEKTLAFKGERAADANSLGGASIAETRALSKDALAPAPAGAAFFESSKTQVVAATPPASQVFNRLDLPAGGRRAFGALIAPAPILASFRVEQTGNAMRVVDADGSVYTGAVQVAEQEGAARAATPKNAPAVASVAIVAAPPQAAQNYYFRVAGTNHNLNQNVIFSGNLIPLTNAPILTGAAGAQRALELPAESLLSNSRISGKAVVGDQKEIEVNATPAPY